MGDAGANADADVLVVGAGPVGLFTAVNLRLRGVSARVVEKHATLTNLHESKSIVLQPRSMELFHHHGLSPRLLQYAVRLDHAMVVDQAAHVLSDVQFSSVQEDTLFPSIYVVPQGILERVLYERLFELGGVVEWDSELVALEQDECHVKARFADGTRTEHSFVIGCDGADGIVSTLIGNKSSGESHIPTVPPTIFADVTITAPSIPRNALTIYLLPTVSCIFFPMQLVHDGFASDTTDLPPPRTISRHPPPDDSLSSPVIGTGHGGGGAELGTGPEKANESEQHAPSSVGFFRVVVSDLAGTHAAASAAAATAAHERRRRASSQSMQAQPAAGTTGQHYAHMYGSYDLHRTASASYPANMVPGHDPTIPPPAYDSLHPKGPRAATWNPHPRSSSYSSGSAASSTPSPSFGPNGFVFPAPHSPLTPATASATLTSRASSGSITTSFTMATAAATSFTVTAPSPSGQRQQSPSPTGAASRVSPTGAASRLSPTGSANRLSPQPPMRPPRPLSHEDLDRLALDDESSRELAVNVTPDEFRNCFRDVARVAKVEVQDVYWLKRYVPERRLAERFTLGRIFIAGDSAHSNSIFAGSGLNLGLQDAVNLSWKLSLLIRGHACSTLMDTYEEERREIGNQMLRSVDTLAQLLATRSGTLQTVRNFALSFASSFQFVNDSLSQSFTSVRLSYANTRLTVGPAPAGLAVPMIALESYPDHLRCNIHDLLYRRSEIIVFLFCPNKLSATDKNWMLLEEAAASIRTRFSDELVAFCWIVEEETTGELARAMEDGVVFFDIAKGFSKMCHAEPMRVFLRPDGIVGAALSVTSCDDLVYLSRIFK